MTSDPTRSALDTNQLGNIITFRLARLQSRLNAQGIRKLRDNSDLSLTEWRILLIVTLHTETTLSVIAQESELDKGQLSRAVKSLVSRGLLQSQVNSDDHRQNLLTTTRAGVELHDRLLPIMRARQAELTAEVTADELEVLHRVIDKLEQAAS